MSQQKPASPFGCCFCREALEPIPLSLPDLPWVFALMRPYRCPHCFQCYSRPFSTLLAIPLFGALLAAFMERLGLLPTLKHKPAHSGRRYKLKQDSNGEVVCSK